MRESLAQYTRFGEGTKELYLLVLYQASILRITVGSSNLLQVFHSYPGSEETFSLRQALELLKRCQVGIVALMHLAASVDHLCRESTWAMEVEVNVEGLRVEPLDLLRFALWHVSITHLFTYDTAILALDKGLIVRVSGSALGKLDQ